MADNTKINNLFWIDRLRVLATFCVIILHVTAPILGKYNSISNFDWCVGNIFDSIVRFCVPIFLMISGALLLPKNYNSIKEYLNKRVLRILLPFLFWSFIYIFHDIFIFFKGESLTFKECLEFTLLKLKSGACYHLWYVYMLIGLYLIFPIFSKWIKNSKKNEILYFLIIWLIVIIASLPFIKKFMPDIDLRYFSGYIGYPILGYYLSIRNDDRKKTKIFSYIFIITGILITAIGTFILTKINGNFSHLLYEYLSPNVILTALGVFLLFKNSNQTYSKRTSSIVSFFSKYSYGTYLIHILILSLLYKFGFWYDFINPIIGIPVTSILCFIISTFIIFCINKIPYGKYISG